MDWAPPYFCNTGCRCELERVDREDEAWIWDEYGMRMGWEWTKGVLGIESEDYTLKWRGLYACVLMPLLPKSHFLSYSIGLHQCINILRYQIQVTSLSFVLSGRWHYFWRAVWKNGRSRQSSTTCTAFPWLSNDDNAREEEKSKWKIEITS